MNDPVGRDEQEHQEFRTWHAREHKGRSDRRATRWLIYVAVIGATGFVLWMIVIGVGLLR